MKSRLLIIGLLMSISSLVFAQILEPVKWTFSTEDLGNNEYNLVFKAKIDDGWYVYSQFVEEGGPIPTSFSFDDNANIQLIDKPSETGDKIKEGNDPIFEMYVKKFGHTATFKQRVKIKTDTKITGFFGYMTCDNSRCTSSPENDFSFDLKFKAGVNSEKTGMNEKIEEVKEVIKEEVTEVKDEIEGKEEIAVSANEVNTVNATTEKPVKWHIETEKLNENEYLVKFIAQIDEGWSVYSQHIEEGGPVPTEIKFDLEKSNLSGETEEQGEHRFEGIDPNFDLKVIKYKEDVTFSQKLKIDNPEKDITGYLKFMTCTDNKCLSPETLDFNINFSKNVAKIAGSEGVISDNGADCYGKYGCPVGECEISAVDVKGQSNWWIFLLGFGSGLIALLTPCVFPMIPLTVSFFLKSSKDRKKAILNALLYGFFIVLIYVLLSLPFVIFRTTASDMYNQIASGAVLNIIYFIIFVVFALSFFGLFDISLPTSFTNKVDSMSGVTSVFGIFFMALTLAIISFTCTGAFIGNLLGLAGSPGMGQYAILWGFMGFGLAFGIPFALFAIFPTLLNSMPKSGGWMNTVKIVLGFIELIFAFKFLSNADLVKQWGLLKREVFLGIWALLGLGLTLYSFGILKFKGDSKPGWGRKIVGLAALFFTVYCLWGIPGNRLPLLSGFPPPSHYAWLKKEHKHAVNLVMNDYEKALELAKKENKPIMLDFTGWSCVNCRKMEENVWTERDVEKILNEKYIVASLYVDDRTELPKEKQYVSESNGRTVNTTGKYFSEMQKKYFKSNTQPYYILISPDEKILNKPVGFTPKVEDYVNFLNCGLDNYESIAKK